MKTNTSYYIWNHRLVFMCPCFCSCVLESWNGISRDSKKSITLGDFIYPLSSPKKSVLEGTFWEGGSFHINSAIKYRFGLILVFNWLSHHHTQFTQIHWKKLNSQGLRFALGFQRSIKLVQTPTRNITQSWGCRPNFPTLANHDSLMLLVTWKWCVWIIIGFLNSHVPPDSTYHISEN